MKLSDVVPVGASATHATIVTMDLTVAHWVPGMPPVYGTPFLIYLMEVAAADAIRPYLPAGYITVGAQVNVTHLAPTPVGMTVTASARVTSVGERTVSFVVEAHDGVERIGEGTHVRGAVNPVTFDARWRRKAAAAGEMSSTGVS
jgi:fluoroacetyl-CoA thioesterase